MANHLRRRASEDEDEATVCSGLIHQVYADKYDDDDIDKNDTEKTKTETTDPRGAEDDVDEDLAGLEEYTDSNRPVMCSAADASVNTATATATTSAVATAHECDNATVAVTMSEQQRLVALVRSLPFYYLLHLYVILQLALSGEWKGRRWGTRSSSSSSSNQA